MATTTREPKTFAPWNTDWWTTQCTPSKLVAGDVVDSGWVVQVAAANGYWASVGIKAQRSLAEALSSAREHDRSVMAGEIEAYEGDAHHARYRLSRAIRTYKNSVSYRVQAEAYEWRGGSSDDPRPLDDTCDL